MVSSVTGVKENTGSTMDSSPSSSSDELFNENCDCMCDSLCLLQDARTIHQVLSALIAQPVSSLLVTVLVLVENRSGNSFFYPTGVGNVCCVSL